MTSTHPRSTWRWAKLRTARLAIAEANNEPCALCAQAIDYRADRRTRWGATVDHPDPIRWGGNPYPPLEDLQPAHRYCQGLQGAAIANAVQGLGPGSRGGNPTTWQPRKARKAPQRPPKAGGPPTADPTPKRSESGPDGVSSGAPRSTPREESLPLSLPPGVSGGSAAVHPQLRPKSRGLLAVAADSAPLWLPAHSHGWDDESGPAAVPGLSPRPPSAVWPRFMTARHPDAAGSLYDQFDGWTRPRFGMHPKRTTGRRWWQELVARRALEVDAEGRLCWDTVCVSTPRQCLDGDTVVFRRDGSACRLRDHEDAWSTGVKPTRRYTARGGASFVATDNHPVMTPDGWRAAGDLRAGDLIATLVGWDAPAQVEVSDEEAAFLGWMVTDGTGSWRTGSKGQSPKFTNVRGDYLDEVEALAKSLFGVSAKRYAKGSGTDLLLTQPHGTTARNPVDRWLSSQGLDAAFPTEVFRWGRRAVGVFLSRAWAGNGCVRMKHGSEEEVFLAAGNSEVCARYWQALLARWGVTSTCKPERHSGADGPVFWRLVLSPGVRNLDAFFDLVGEVPGKPRVRAVGNREHRRPVHSVGGDGERFRWRPLIRVEDAGDREVFDVVYPGKGWFVAGCAQVHNSGKSWLLREMCLARMALAERMGEVQTVVHTAVKLQHAFAVWNPAGRWARNRPEYTVRFANGEQQIEDPVDGSVWMIQAANEGLGVSLSVSLALVDEAWGVRRELVDNALVPTMAESEQPQLWVISTAGVPKAGEDMTDLVPGMRRLGAAREQREVLYVEWSAPRSADIDDPAVWRAASAHWDDRRLARVASARSKAETPKDTESFRRQWLNQWPDARAGADALVAGDVWARAGVSGLVPPRDRTVLGVSLDERTGLWPVAVAWVVDRAGSVPRVGVRLVGVFGSQDDAVAAVAGVRGQACQLVVPRWLTRNQVRVPGVRQVWQATDDEAVQALRLGVHRLQAGLLVHDPADEGTSAAVLDLPGARQSRRYDAGTLLLLCALFAARPADRAGSA